MRGAIPPRTRLPFQPALFLLGLQVAAASSGGAVTGVAGAAGAGPEEQPATDRGAAAVCSDDADAVEGACEAKAQPARASIATGVDGAAASGNAVACAPGADGNEGECEAKPAPELASFVEASIDVDDIAADSQGRRKRDKEIDGVSSAARLGLVFFMFCSLICWIGLLVRYMIDGSLPARLAMWGLMPEVCAAISPRSIVALLRMKKEPTPVIILRSCVTDKGAEELAQGVIEYGPKSELQVLELPHNPGLTSVGLRRIVAASRADGVQVCEFDLSSNPQLRATLPLDLQPALTAKKNSMQVLKLADCDLVAEGLTKLTDLLAMSHLRSLDLSYNLLTGGGEALASAMDAPLLQELTLTCCGLGVPDIKEVAEQLPFTSIRSLQVGGNRFGDEGLAVIVENLPASQVQELGLEANNLTPACFAGLGDAWAKRPFSQLRLAGNQMTQQEVGGFIRTLKTIHS